MGSGKGILIAFMDFHLEDDIGCDNDKVKVKGDRMIFLLVNGGVS